MIYMMLVPRRNFDLFDDFFDDNFFNKKEKNLMKTDIKETKDKYTIEMDLPGFEKENIKLELNNGYLKITVNKKTKSMKKKKNMYTKKDSMENVQDHSLLAIILKKKISMLNLKMEY